MSRLVAHRGFSSRYSENTMSAFKGVFSTSCRFIEFDVRKTRDNVPVVFHDSCLDRMVPGDSRKIHNVAACELDAIKIQQRDKIPRLEEVLLEFGDTVKYDIEIKTKNTAESVLKVLQNSGVSHDNILITSFDWGEIREIKRMNPLIETGLISMARPRRCIDECVLTGSSVAVIYKHVITRRIVEYAHARNVKIFAYTVNDVKSIEKLLDIGVDMIITDFPDINLP